MGLWQEQPSTAQPDQCWIEATCGQKYETSESRECHIGPILGGKLEHGSCICSLLYAVGLSSANIVLTEPAVRFASVEQIQNTDLGGRQAPTLHKHSANPKRLFSIFRHFSIFENLALCA